MELIVLGAGRGAVELLDLVADVNDAAGRERFRPVGFLDDDVARHGARIEGLPILGRLADAHRFPAALFANAIGSPANHRHRDAIVARTGLGPERFATIVHPSASVSRASRLGPGTVLFPHVTVRSHALLGQGVLVLANAVVEHDAVIGDHSCVASGAGLAGGVRVGRCCYLGANCSVIGNVAIGDRALVGMGAVVLHDVAPDTVVVGNPARLLRRTDQA